QPVESGGRQRPRAEVHAAPRRAARAARRQATGATIVMTARLGAVIVALLAAGAALDSQQPGAVFPAKEPAALPRTNWPKNGGSLSNQNYSPLTQINRDTVGDLKGVWRTHLDGSGLAPKYSGEAQPVVQDGVVYIVTGADDVFA